MGKLWIVVILAVMLAGCSQPEDFETVMDSAVKQEAAEKMEIVINLPADAAQAVMSSEETGAVYFCEDYVLTVQTVEGGDLQKTMVAATGFYPEQLPIMETLQGNAKRYACVWTAAGENGDQVGRCTVLDDGSYHYVLTAMADAQKAGALTEGVWQEIFNSFRLIHPEDVVSSGS